MTPPNDATAADDALLAALTQDENEEDNAPSSSQTKSPAQRSSRLQQLNREKQNADALANHSMAQAAALRDQTASGGTNPTVRAQDDHTRAVAEHAVRQAGADLLTRQANFARDAARLKAQEAWSEATAGLRQRVPDFEDVAHHPNLAITPIMAEALLDSPRGAEIAYYLGKNPMEATRIAGLAPVSQATAIARLENRIEAMSQSISKAPPPVGTVLGGSAGSAKRLEDLSFDQYRKARGY